jgi:hypothetical protein
MGNNKKKNPQPPEPTQPTQPPEPPEVERRNAFYLPQFVIMCVIALIPLLAVVGVFGDRTESAEAEGAGLLLHVDYPRLMHYKTDDLLVVTVQNASEQVLDGVIVRIPEAYLSKFSNVVFTPEIRRITTDAYEVELDGLEPGASRMITVELEGNDAGQHEGMVSAVVPNAEVPPVTITTLVFP